MLANGRWSQSLPDVVESVALARRIKQFPASNYETAILTEVLYGSLQWQQQNLVHGCINSRHHVDWVTEFCRVAANI
jgi:hypothetical protein